MGISDIKDKLTSPEDREVLSPWMTLGIIMHDLYGLSYQEVCDKIRNGKGGDTLARAGRSPAGQRLREYLTEFRDQPEKLTRLIIQASSLDVAADLLLALEWARETRDYRAMHSISKDLLAMGGVTTEPKKQQAAPQAIHIHLGSGSLDIPAAETSWEFVDDDS